MLNVHLYFRMNRSRKKGDAKRKIILIWKENKEENDRKSESINI